MLNKKKLLAKVGQYELKCNGIYHYFTGKTIKNVKIEKCWCKIGGRNNE